MRLKEKNYQRRKYLENLTEYIKSAFEKYDLYFIWKTGWGENDKDPINIFAEDDREDDPILETFLKGILDEPLTDFDRDSDELVLDNFLEDIVETFLSQNEYYLKDRTVKMHGAKTQSSCSHGNLESLSVYVMLNEVLK